jgi:hypothetical protein
MTALKGYFILHVQYLAYLMAGSTLNGLEVVSLLHINYFALCMADSILNISQSRILLMYST